MTERSEYVTTDDGVRLFVKIVGNDPSAVIVPNRIYLAEAFARLANHRTLIFCDPRNRGLSDAVTDLARTERGVHHDVEDFEAIRRHFGFDRVSLIGLSGSHGSNRFDWTDGTRSGAPLRRRPRE
jgi:pimeloyl-ACP methyl ester carboxylesterase